MKMKMSVCDTALQKVTYTSSLHKTPCRLLTVSACVRMCAHITTLYLLNVTDCRGGLGNVSKYARLNEKSRRGIMGFHNTLLLLGMPAWVFGRKQQHITLYPSQICALTKDFIAADRQRAMECATQSLNRTENLSGSFGSPGWRSLHNCPSYPVLSPPLLAGLQSHCPGHNGARLGLRLVTPDAQWFYIILKCGPRVSTAASM